MTTTPVASRMMGLDTTGAPLPFECCCAAGIGGMSRVEKAPHEAVGDSRVRKSREFFCLDPYRVKVTLELLAIDDVVPRGEVVQDASDVKVSAAARRSRPRFRLSTAHVPGGSTREVSRGADLTATVLDAVRIDFRGKSRA